MEGKKTPIIKKSLNKNSKAHNHTLVAYWCGACALCWRCDCIPTTRQQQGWAVAYDEAWGRNSMMNP